MYENLVNNGIFTISTGKPHFFHQQYVPREFHFSNVVPFNLLGQDFVRMKVLQMFAFNLFLVCHPCCFPVAMPQND